MASKVASAWQPAAMAAPNRIACSACSEPSVQIRIFMSLCRVARQQTMDEHRRPNERQRDECHTDALADKKLCEGGADLSADGRAGVHHQRDENIDIAFLSVTEGAVAG